MPLVKRTHRYFLGRRVYGVRRGIACVLEKEHTALPALVPPRIILPYRALFVHIFLLAGKIIRGGMRQSGRKLASTHKIAREENAAIQISQTGTTLSFR